MKKNLLKLSSLLILPLLVTGCRGAIDDNGGNTDDDEDDYIVTSKKITNQWVLPYDWTYNKYDRKYESVNLITSTSELKSSSNAFIKTVVDNQFRGEMPSSSDGYDVIGYNPFEKYDDTYFSDHILLVGIAYLTSGCTLYTNGIGQEPYEYYLLDSNGKRYLDDVFTPFYVDEVYETKPSSDQESRLILYIYDEFQISTSAYKDKTASQIKALFLDTSDSSKTELEYYSHTIYKDEYNEKHQDNKIS